MLAGPSFQQQALGRDSSRHKRSSGCSLRALMTFFAFCCGSMYGSPFSFLFLALSGDSSDEEAEEDDDDEGGGGDFSCVQFGSRYQEWSLTLHVPST